MLRKTFEIRVICDANDVDLVVNSVVDNYRFNVTETSKVYKNRHNNKVRVYLKFKIDTDDDNDNNDDEYDEDDDDDDNDDDDDDDDNDNMILNEFSNCRYFDHPSEEKNECYENCLNYGGCKAHQGYYESYYKYKNNDNDDKVDDNDDDVEIPF